MATSSITNALIAVLEGDVTLASLVPDGIWFGTAPPHASRFVLVSLVETTTIWEFQRRAIEEKRYSVRAVMRKELGVDLALAQSAGARIETILDGARLLASGYDPMDCVLEASIESDPEVDGSDDSVRWFQQGGIYNVQMSCA